MKIYQILEDLSYKFKTVTTTPRLDAELLLQFILNCTKTELILKFNEFLDSKDLANLRLLVNRRLKNEPIAYLIKMKEFYGNTFEVDSRVLIPRPETEILVEQSLNFCKSKIKPKILDLGTGSACIPISLALELNQINRDYEIYAVDASLAALDLALINAKKFNLDQRIKLLQSNWFENLQGLKFDLIIANPPYIDPAADVYAGAIYEPQTALYAGDNGLADIKHIIKSANQYMEPEAMLIIEFGYNQAEQVLNYAKNFFECRILKDLAGLPRVAIMEKKNV